MAQTPPFAIAETTPADTDFVRVFPAAERLFRDIVESWFARISDATTGEIKIRTDTTANLGAITFPLGGVQFDTTLGILRVARSAGPQVWDAISVPAGTKMSFQQATVPPGWTIDAAAANDRATIRLRNSAAATTGGTTVFETVFAARTIAQANLPNVNFALTGATTNDPGGHTHSISSDAAHRHQAFADYQHNSGTPVIDSTHSAARATVSGTASGNYIMVHDNSGTDASVGRTSEAGSHNHGGASGSAGGHTHTVSGNAASGGSGTALDFAVKFVDFIVCTKN